MEPTIIEVMTDGNDVNFVCENEIAFTFRCVNGVNANDVWQMFKEAFDEEYKKNGVNGKWKFLFR